jgi:hypothetical protein
MRDLSHYVWRRYLSDSSSVAGGKEVAVAVATVARAVAKLSLDDFRK